MARTLKERFRGWLLESHPAGTVSIEVTMPGYDELIRNLKTIEATIDRLQTKVEKLDKTIGGLKL